MEIDTIIYPLLEIDNQIINLLHIGSILQLSQSNRAAKKKIINSQKYISARQFYNNQKNCLADINSQKYISARQFYNNQKNSYFCNFCIVENYFFAACQQGKLEIIRYLAEKYDYSPVVFKIGYEEILTTNNVPLIKQFSREFGNISPGNLNSDIKWSLLPNTYDYIFGLDNLPCDSNSLDTAMSYGNSELVSYIYNHGKSNIPMHKFYYLFTGYWNIGQLKWIVNNIKIDVTITNYFNHFPFVWLYYNSKYNGKIYSNPTDQFLIIFSLIIFEDKSLDILSELFPVKNQIDQEIIYNCIATTGVWRKLDLAKYLVQQFLIDQNRISILCFYQTDSELMDCLLEKLDNYSGLAGEPTNKFFSNKLLTEKLIAKNQIPKSILNEKGFITAAIENNLRLLKYILENSKLDIPEIKNGFSNILITDAKIVEFLLEIGLIDFQYIKKWYISKIYQDYICRTELLSLIISEAKKARYKLNIDKNYLFQLASKASKKQAQLVYDNFKEFIHLDKNSIVWLGIIPNKKFDL